MIPITTHSHLRLYRSASAAGWPRPPSPVAGQPATPNTDTPCVTVRDTCGFNSSIDSFLNHLELRMTAIMLINANAVCLLVVLYDRRRRQISRSYSHFRLSSFETRLCTSLADDLLCCCCDVRSTLCKCSADGR